MSRASVFQATDDPPNKRQVARFVIQILATRHLRHESIDEHGHDGTPVREALGRSPLMKTGGANSPGVERVPKVTAATRPTVILAGRPAAERAPGTGAGGSQAFLLIRLAIKDSGPHRLFGANQNKIQRCSVVLSKGDQGTWGVLINWPASSTFEAEDSAVIFMYSRAKPMNMNGSTTITPAIDATVRTRKGN